jgi:NTE family protein
VTGGGQERGPTVALVLGSGGARGLAHVGVIETLIEYGYEIAYISGCSMGALVGGAFAAGRLEAYRDWAVSLERKHIVSLLDFSFGWQGLFKGENRCSTPSALRSRSRAC